MKTKAGWVVTALLSLAFLFSAFMKLTGGEEVVKGMAQVGLPEHILLALGILELSCVILYIIPKTAFFGSILLTGYIGGAILTHVRVGEPFVTQILFGILVWVGFGLRNYDNTMRLIR